MSLTAASTQRARGQRASRELGSYGGLGRITVPTLVIGATHDTMDPEHMEWMASPFGNGRFWLCPDGSHMSHIDDEQVYFEGLTRFLRDVDGGRS